MDYKAKYEEALERAKRWADGTLQPERTTPQDVCEVIFPELAEDEDERTRKEIIGFIQSQIEDGNSAGWDRWIAWLEKQKEPETASASSIPSCWEEKQEEQKQTEGKYYSSPDCGTTTGVWSEEDEEMIKTIVGILERSSQVTTYEQRGGSLVAAVGCSNKYPKEIDWLKSLRPQPKCLPGFDEMTPEEKMNHPLYLEGFDAGRDVGKVETDWKPTEAQMNNLNFGINALEKDGWVETARAIKDFYSDLKKLMED